MKKYRVPDAVRPLYEEAKPMFTSTNEVEESDAKYSVDWDSIDARIDAQEAKKAS